MVVGSLLFGATVKLNNLVHNAELPGKRFIIKVFFAYLSYFSFYIMEKSIHKTTLHVALDTFICINQNRPSDSQTKIISFVG
jgi:hypothetical protein